MSSRFNNWQWNFPCQICHKQFKVRLGSLKKKAEIKCPHCKGINKIEDDAWNRAKKEFEKLSDDLKRQFK